MLNTRTPKTPYKHKYPFCSRDGKRRPEGRGELDTEGQTGLASGYGRRLEFLMVVGLNPGDSKGFSLAKFSIKVHLYFNLNINFSNLAPFDTNYEKVWILR